MNNPIEIIKRFMQQGNPKQLVEKMIMNNSNPIIKDLIKKAEAGDTESVKEFARNVYKQQGRDFDKEYDQFMTYFK